MNSNNKVGIVGDGRLAKHFKQYFKLLDLPYSSWSRKDTSSFFEFASKQDIILLMISDDSIESFYRENPLLKEKICFHFSGALSLDGIHSCHPLMTFSNHHYSIAEYQRIPFIGELGKMQLSDLIPALENKAVMIPSNMKDKYHAWCVMAGNFSVILWQEFAANMKCDFDISNDLIKPYMRQIFNNMDYDLDCSLTGPLVRNDNETMKKNLNALDGVYEQLYRSFLGVKNINLEK